MSHSGTVISGSFAGVSSRQETSRATPHIDSQSGRFGVTSTSIRVSPGNRVSTGVPSFSDESRIISPS